MRAEETEGLPSGDMENDVFASSALINPVRLASLSYADGRWDLSPTSTEHKAMHKASRLGAPAKIVM